MRYIEKFGLVGLGLLSGLAIALHLSAIAEKETVATPLPIAELREFSEVFARIKDSYVESVTDKKLITGAISGMLSDLDPHSTYLDEDAYKELQVGTHGEFGGLGIQVGMEDDTVKVIAPIEDTPAFEAGVKSGDLIIKIDGKLIKGFTLGKAVKLMRGKPDTKIVLTILRKGETKPLEITIIRAIIKVKSVKPKLVESGYGYVRITQFQDKTGENLATALSDLIEENEEPLKGLVLDLRNDPGGLLTSAVGVSATFLPEDTLVVYTEGRTANAKMSLSASPENYLRNDTKDYLKDLPKSIKSVPMIVLVNAGSASASEIVAGALQDHKRAVILGTQTFGKASVQTVLPLSNNTAIKLTTARYYTPNGRSIQAKGIVPDIIVEDPADAGNNRNLYRIREVDLNKHLENDNPEDADTKEPDSIKLNNGLPIPDDKDGESKSRKFKPTLLGSENDYQLNQALNLLKGMNILRGANTSSDE